MGDKFKTWTVSLTVRRSNGHTPNPIPIAKRALYAALLGVVTAVAVLATSYLNQLSSEMKVPEPQVVPRATTIQQ